MMDEPYVLASQATQVFYVEDKRHKNQYVVVKTKAKDVFDASIGPQSDEDDTYSFYENVPYNISTNQVVSDNLGQARDDVEGMTIDASIIAKRDCHEVNNLDDYEFIDDESNTEDDNEDEYTKDEQCNSLVVYPFMNQLKCLCVVFDEFVNSFNFYLLCIQFLPLFAIGFEIHFL